jgi:hypothetical protein
MTGRRTGEPQDAVLGRTADTAVAPAAEDVGGDDIRAFLQHAGSDLMLCAAGEGGAPHIFCR